MKHEKKTKTGTVVKRSGDKTVVVLVERKVKHPVFKKYVTKRKKFHIHDETNAANAGDRVQIIECRPISKSKSWRLQSIIERAK